MGEHDSSMRISLDSEHRGARHWANNGSRGCLTLCAMSGCTVSVCAS